MKQRPTWFFLAALSCGCGDSAADLRDPIDLTGAPVALEEKLLLVSGPSRKAFLLDAVKAEPNVRAAEVPLPVGALRAERREKHDEALVICAGRRVSATEPAEPATLSAISASGSVRNYELGTTPFDKLVQSEDGRYAVLYRGPDAENRRTLQNVNELVVVDLDKQPSDVGAVTSKTPEGLAHAFTKAVVSPALPIAGEMRRLLVLLSEAEITLFDLAHLDRRGTIVEIGGSDGRMPQPQQVLFGKNEPTLYVRGDNTDDVFVFRLEERTSEAALNDFRPTINPLGAGAGPRDMDLFGAEDAPQVLVVSSAQQARLIDPRSGKTAILPLPAPADEIYLFDGVSPRDTQSRKRALLYGKESKTLMFMDLDAARDRPERNIETLQVSAPVTSLIEIDRDNTLVLTHAQGVTLLDLEQRTATPIAAEAPLEGALYDPVTERLWVASKAQPWVGSLDLVSGETGELLLDADVSYIAPFFEAGRLVALHPSAIGHVTFVDTKEPVRERARSIEGFLLSGILDRGDE